MFWRELPRWREALQLGLGNPQSALAGATIRALALPAPITVMREETLFLSST
jgi:hypothetical protein